jgi:hypothetical protein
LVGPRARIFRPDASGMTSGCGCLPIAWGLLNQFGVAKHIAVWWCVFRDAKALAGPSP